MSYNWKAVEGQDWSNRARYNIYKIMREKNIAGTSVHLDGLSHKKLFVFMSGRQDITLTKLQLLADFLDVRFYDLFNPIPANPKTFKRAYRRREDV